MDEDEKKEMRSVLLPMIRKVLPGLIAQDIIGVQPMTGVLDDHPLKTWEAEDQFHEIHYWVTPKLHGNIFKMKMNYSQKTEYEDVPSPEYTWCVQTFGPEQMKSNKVAGTWWKSGSDYVFRREEDRLAFVLRWQ